LGRDSWLSTKLGLPALRDQVAAARLAWDYALCNDVAITASDPCMDRVRQACALLDVEPDPAFAALLTLADGGSVWSMLNVGWCFEVGRGAVASEHDAEAWYRRASERGCDRAALEYGRLLGLRGAMDLERAAYAEGVARGWAPALYRTAKLGLQHARTASERRQWLPMLQQATDLGSPSAKAWLARGMSHGWFGLWRIPAGFYLGFQIVNELDAGTSKPAP
jgi:TPR repeat protein